MQVEEEVPAQPEERSEESEVIKIEIMNSVPAEPDDEGGTAFNRN